MTEQPAVPPAEAPKKSRRTWLIVLLVVLVLCCLCVVVPSIVGYLWKNGDQLFGLTSRMAGVF
jgi:hypothetical protein